jgi:hypothetical protein
MDVSSKHGGVKSKNEGMRSGCGACVPPGPAAACPARGRAALKPPPAGSPPLASARHPPRGVRRAGLQPSAGTAQGRSPRPRHGASRERGPPPRPPPMRAAAAAASTPARQAKAHARSQAATYPHPIRLHNAHFYGHAQWTSHWASAPHPLNARPQSCRAKTSPCAAAAPRAQKQGEQHSKAPRPAPPRARHPLLPPSFAEPPPAPATGQKNKVNRRSLSRHQSPPRPPRLHAVARTTRRADSVKGGPRQLRHTSRRNRLQLAPNTPQCLYKADVRDCRCCTGPAGGHGIVAIPG